MSRTQGALHEKGGYLTIYMHVVVCRFPFVTHIVVFSDQQGEGEMLIQHRVDNGHGHTSQQPKETGRYTVINIRILQ